MFFLVINVLAIFDFCAGSGNKNFMGQSMYFGSFLHIIRSLQSNCFTS